LPQDIKLRVKPLPKIFSIAGVALLSLTAGVQDLVISGRLRVKMKPLTDHMPIVGAIHVAFVQAPQIAFSLRIFGGSLNAM
jgi:Ca2+-dependent lipid-binding protein